jgi:hypothetical protein
MGQGEQQVLTEVLAEQEGQSRWFLQEKGRERSKPHSGHLLRAMAWFQSPQRWKEATPEERESEGSLLAYL